MGDKTRRYDDAFVHLDVLGHACTIEARVRVGEARPTDILPLARAIASRTSEIGAAVAAERGQTVSCRAGCAACCRHIVPVAPLEALALARLVKALPPKRREIVRRRFAAALRRLEDLGLLDRNAPRGRSGLQTHAREIGAAWAEANARYFVAGIACPFLEDERCSIYEERPVACREFQVVTPAERCSSLDSGVETTPRAIFMSEVLSDLSATLADVPARGIPLVLALEWAEVDGALLDRKVDGQDLFHLLTEHVAAHAEGD
jgi:Fe-S-cluster containining protein